MQPKPLTDRATLLVKCEDRPGLVASLAQALYGQGANILHADQHTETSTGRFFQRIHFQDPELAGPDPEAASRRLESTVRAVAARDEMTWKICYGQRAKRVAIFVSKTEHCLYDLLLRHRAGEISCEIPLIISNHQTLRPVAEQFKIPYHWIPVNAETKAEAEARQRALLEEHQIDLAVLARYMQILSKEFITAYSDRIINIHHSFLPAFAGGRPYHQAATRGVKLIGATAHYATTDLDEGPIIEQGVIRVSHRDQLPDLVAKGRDVERTVLSRAVRWHLEDRILVDQNKTVVFAA